MLIQKEAYPPKKVRRRISASLRISLERLMDGARCAYSSISKITSLMIASMVSRLGTKVARMEESDTDIVAPMTRRVWLTMERAPCQR
jgi:hypothetical protein